MPLYTVYNEAWHIVSVQYVFLSGTGHPMTIVRAVFAEERPGHPGEQREDNYSRLWTALHEALHVTPLDVDVTMSTCSVPPARLGGGRVPDIGFAPGAKFSRYVPE